MTVSKTHFINLDMYTPNAKKFRVVEGDTANILQITLTDRGTPVDLSGCRVLVVFAREGQPAEQDNDGHGVTITGEHHNVILVDLYANSYTNGENTAQVVVYSGENFEKQATSAWFNFDGERAFISENTLQSTPTFPILESALNRLANVERGVQADYGKADAQDPAYIKNKPVVGTDTQAATQTLEAATVAISDTAMLPAHDEGHVSITWAQVKTWISSALATVFAPIAHSSQHAAGEGDALSLRFSDTVVNTTSFALQGTPTYDTHPYRAAVELSGVTASHDVRDVVFNQPELNLGIFSGNAISYDGGIYIFATEVPSYNITIPRIICDK